MYVCLLRSCVSLTSSDRWILYTRILNLCVAIPKGGRSANKFRKSQIRKFADLNSLLDLQTFRKCGTLRICDLQIPPPQLFCDLRTFNFRTSAKQWAFSCYICEYSEYSGRSASTSHLWYEQRSAHVCGLQSSLHYHEICHRYPFTDKPTTTKNWFFQPYSSYIWKCSEVDHKAALSNLTLFSITFYKDVIEIYTYNTLS